MSVFSVLVKAQLESDPQFSQIPRILLQ